jgi:rhodanese-related sulfurtransferase
MIAQLRPSQLPQWLEAMRQYGEPVVLDVREPAELAAASVRADGFKLLAIPMGEIPSRLGELPPDQPLACLCHHGARSMRVAAFLQAQGFSQVANIAGGIQAWSEELDPRVPQY